MTDGETGVVAGQKAASSDGGVAVGDHIRADGVAAYDGDATWQRALGGVAVGGGEYGADGEVAGASGAAGAETDAVGDADGGTGGAVASGEVAVGCDEDGAVVGAAGAAIVGASCQVTGAAVGFGYLVHRSDVGGAVLMVAFFCLYRHHPYMSLQKVVWETTLTKSWAFALPPLDAAPCFAFYRRLHQVWRQPDLPPL